MKTALITGGSSGIGEALALELARRGWRLVLTARRGDLLENVASRVRSAGAEALALTCDVRQRDEVRQVVARALSAYGSIDLAVANAGIGIPTPAAKFSVEDAELIMRTNFDGMIYLFDAVITDMLARNAGQFAGVASLAGLRGLPTSGMYSASKAAMQAFLEAARAELRPRGIYVTVINPGFVTTPMTEKNKFRMPFLMSAEKAATIMADGLEARDRVIEFPRPTSLLMRLSRVVPSALYDRAVSPYAKRSIDSGRLRK